jgi:hypothetical protein
MVPGLVENSVMGGLYQPRFHVNIADVLICSSVPNENPSKRVLIKFGAALPGPFDANTGPKNAKATKIRFEAFHASKGVIRMDL